MPSEQIKCENVKEEVLAIRVAAILLEIDANELNNVFAS